MRFIVDTPPRGPVDVSLVLLDWGCRESFHLLDYLAHQTVSRDRYQIIWTEFYDASPSLCELIEAARRAGRPLPVDIYAALEIDRSVCYHKHLLMNLGIALAAGRIVCIADSDAIASPRFIESIIESFDRDSNIVLHLDEVRNNDPRFHPFGYPSLVDIRGFGCINWVNGRPIGLADKTDPLHSRNYGACMAALRSDMIAAGGLDMHVDYLAHISGPYELTWRLINAGKREVWHDREWLYHVWHPGQAGDGDVIGPHDGMHISSPALEHRASGQTAPEVENEAIAMLRQGGQVADRSKLLDALIDPKWLEQWRYSRLRTDQRTGPFGSATRYIVQNGPERQIGRRQPPFGRRLPRRARLGAACMAVGLVWRQLKVKWRSAMWSYRSDAAGGGGLFRKPAALLRFLKRIAAYDRYLLRQCWLALAYAAQEGHREIILYGQGDAARALCALSRWLGLRITAICPFAPDRPQRLLGRPTIAPGDLSAAPGVVMIAAFVDTQRHLETLEAMGVDRRRIISLQ
ncbi:MAG: hypothetical protein LLG01_16110 [Planctomycetaceae bacterium]|nr:hypothetical protein [Planctomycetaceae bacterium]